MGTSTYISFDYYPFGMVMPGRQFASSSGDYRFGFNGMEKDGEEWTGSSGNQLDFGARIYDSRLGRFLSLDPLSKKFPSEGNYSFAGNDPISNIDEEGEKKTWYVNFIDQSGNKTTLVLINKDDVRFKPTSTYGSFYFSADVTQEVNLYYNDKGLYSIEMGNERFTESDQNYNIANLKGDDNSIEAGYIIHNSSGAGSKLWLEIGNNAEKEIYGAIDLSNFVTPDNPAKKGLTEVIEALGELNSDVKKFWQIMDVVLESGTKSVEVVTTAQENSSNKEIKSDSLIITKDKNNNTVGQFFKDKPYSNKVDTVTKIIE
jgi:RHS repeat-associated protein